MNNLSNSKSKSSLENSKNHKLKNKELIQELEKKKKEEKEKEEVKRLKKFKYQEKLKNQILQQAADFREEKKARQSSIEVKKEKTPPKKEKIKSHSTPKTNRKETEKKKLKMYFRSRYATYIESIKKTKKQKQENNEERMKREEEMRQKLKAAYNARPKLLQETSSYNRKKVTKRCVSVSSDSSVKRKERESEVKKAQKKLLERQKSYLESLSQKNTEENARREEESKKEAEKREALKQKVLQSLKRQSDSVEIEEEPESPKVKLQRREKVEKEIRESKSLNGLNLETKKGRFSFDEFIAQPRDYPFISSVDQWLKKKGLPPDSKVFIITGGYPDLKEALLKRNWIENPHSNSKCFHLKWTLKAKDVDHDELKDYQIVNHFSNNIAITTKAGLSRSLRNLIWFNNVDVDTFYPLCFDFSESDELENFIQEFKCIKAESILKEFVGNPSIIIENEQKSAQISVALEICQRRVMDLDDLIVQENIFNLVSSKEWDIIGEDEPSAQQLAIKRHQTFLDNLKSKRRKKPKKKKAKNKKRYIPVDGSKNLEEQKELSVEKKDSELEENENSDNQKEDDKEHSNNEETKNETLEDQEQEQNNAEDEMKNLITEVNATLEKLKSKFPQFSINGTQNIWIVKPAGLSRGRGIKCMKSLNEITGLIKGKENQFVIQKYIERPLLVKGRKFDIRQWVLASSFNPLTIWFYDECYIRFSAEDYDEMDLDNNFIHLTNNSIAKYSKKFENSEIEGCMWYDKDLADYLKLENGDDAFNERIRPRLKEIVTYSLQSVQDSIESRMNTFELYGYDFMIDEDLNPWLIEINSSPAMDYSSSVTKYMVKSVMEDCVKVMVDYSLAKKKKDIDTGLFRKIFKGGVVSEKLSTVGLDLVCEGTKIRKNKKKKN